MIMKKLYARNKELEQGIQKAQIIVKDHKFKTSEGFYNSQQPKWAEEKENIDETEDVIEIGCGDCDKLRDWESTLIKDLELKAKHIQDLEAKLVQKFSIDINSYQS